MPPTIYQTGWFRAACVLALGLIVVLLFFWRLRQMENDVKSHLSERLIERERIARELHDTLLQGFQGLLLRFQTATSKIPSGEPARTMMESALDRADEVLIEGRNRVRHLRSEDPSANDLVEALRLIGAELKLNYPADFKVAVRGTYRQLHPVVREEVYWIGREALFNAFTHSNGSSIECDVAFERNGFVLQIRDNGKGIDGETLVAGRSGHWGLSGMRERAEKLKAELEIWSKDEGGTEIELKISPRIAYAAINTASTTWSFLRRLTRRGSDSPKR